MSQARVTSIDAVKDWKEDLCAFQEAAKEALILVEMEIRRTVEWLDEQRRYWQSEVRRRDDLVVQAKAELWRRKMLPVVGKHPDCIEQEKALRRAQLALREAEEKVELTRRWAVTLQRSVDEYQSQGRQLSNVLEAGVPKGLNLLEQKIAALEAYVAVTSALPVLATEPKPDAAEAAEPAKAAAKPVAATTPRKP